MQFLKKLLYGISSTITFNSTPLYRYPYRSAPEAFRGDWKHIGGDIEAAFDSFIERDEAGGRDE